MKNSLNLPAAELRCGNAPGLLQGKGTSINTAGAVQASPFGTCWSCEAVRTSSGWGGAESRQAGREHPHYSLTFRGRAGSRQCHCCHAAAVLQEKPKNNLDFSPCGSWVSPRVPVTDSGSSLLPGSQRTEFVPKCCFVLAWATERGVLGTSASLTQEVGWMSLPPSCGAGVFL